MCVSNEALQAILMSNKVGKGGTLGQSQRSGRMGTGSENDA